MAPTRNETETPSAWLGCLSCYNSGRLVGRWVSAHDYLEADGNLPDIDPTLWESRAYGSGRPFVGCARCGGDEIAALDLDRCPVGIGESFLAWSEFVHETADLDDDGLSDFVEFLNWQYVGGCDDWSDALSRHLETYWGEWETFEDFARHFYESTTGEIPRYFDLDEYARDLAFDYHAERVTERGTVRVWYNA